MPTADADNAHPGVLENLKNCTVCFDLSHKFQRVQDRVILHPLFVVFVVSGDSLDHNQVMTVMTVMT